MKTGKKLISIIAGCAVLAGLAGCAGKDNVDKEPSSSAKSQTAATYFASVPMDYKTGAAGVAGDFDGDGDLDLVVIAKDTALSSSNARLYLFKNDGKGNFYQDSNEKGK